ncbi:pancreatic lipase-related protein 2-like [Anticarsia gemmatalis]|uniref:pancreatic lipase-related protein 2-like n=1 Tax=Anticarsia gemmatalis TaxID=129554 RepID=UPI003F75A635
MKIIAVVFALAVAVSGLPHDPVLTKLDSGLRHQYVEGADGLPVLADLWVKTSDVAEAARYNPLVHNQYHLFTAANPQVSQPLLNGNTALLEASNFNASLQTAVLIHGFQDTVISPFNSVVVAAYIQEDVNVIVVDWSTGASGLYTSAVLNTPTSGIAVASFIAWLSDASGASLDTFHVVGHGLGGHQAGIVGRNLGGQIGYITALDPAFTGWVTNDNKFQPDDGVYTEVVHTSAGLSGYLADLGQVDFYPNGGVDMPGCITQDCDHARSFHYFAESLVSGGFTGNRCSSYLTAMLGQCYIRGTLQMGGRDPKPGNEGIYYFRTYARPPFSRD